jgi:hypothetical protein
MEPEDKCGLLAGELRKILGGGITLSSDVIHYIDSTFSYPASGELQAILQDDSNCERDSLIELILFPDESMQHRLESLLERLQFTATEEKTMSGHLLRKPLQVTFRLPGNSESLNLIITEDAACQFISRLSISKHLPADLRDALKRYDDKNISNRIKVKIRNSRFSPTDEKIEFLFLFFEKFDSQDNDLFECLEFVIGFLDELKQVNDFYQALAAKKKFYFISLQKAKQLETQLQKNNIETLVAQGKRVVLIDQKDARKKMLIIDRISRALYGKTEFFESLHPDGGSIKLCADQDIQEIIKQLS